MDRDFKRYFVDDSSLLKRDTPASSSSSYFEDNLESLIHMTSNAGGSATRKKQRGPAQPQIPPVCQVEGCNTDLRDSKGYHRRHRVCEIHSKTPRSVVDGIEQRFCQQCSRFHVLEEFDDGKRSCRKRLAGHNERRRKPPASAELLIGSSSRISIFPGDFKHYVAPQHNQNQQQQHILDGSFLSSWPAEPSKIISKPVDSAHMLYQSYIQQRDSSHLQEGLYQFLKPNTSDATTATTANLLLPPPCSSSDALSLLSAEHQKSALSQFNGNTNTSSVNNSNMDNKDVSNGSTNTNLQYYRRPDFFNSGLQISGSRSEF